MEPTSEVEIVSLTFPARMARCGIMIRSIVYVLREQSGMVRNV